MRTTLYSRLKPEFKKIVEEKSKQYPACGRSVVESLQQTMYHRLTICEVTDLAVFLSYTTDQITSGGQVKICLT